jgi:hypothetical protein
MNCFWFIHRKFYTVGYLLDARTYEDIDAAFGVIWKWFRQKPCETLEDYKTGIENALK